jgi:hypothetical protein
MIMQRLICKFKGHIIVDAGSCPFTSNTYVACTRCNILKVA